MKIIIDGSGITEFKGRKMRYTIGKGGIAENKVEGDKATPTGFHKPMTIFYRAGRMMRPRNKYFDIYPIYQNDGWCDALNDPSYNHYVRRPYKGSSENLWRKDRLYDMIIVSDYNYPNAIAPYGSAVFIHVCHPEFKPTLGCIGFEPDDLWFIVHNLKPDDGFLVI